jgi:protocatechuate 3,4-dioxygenase beta subunit
VRPRQSEGPYFSDAQLNRRDIRSDPTTGLVSEGVPLQLVFNVFRQQQDGCQALPDAIVDVWHCNASGVYSDVSDRTINTTGQQFLRGFQVTDANGQVEFLTIYPGWYPGRTVHIHFKIRGSDPQPYEFTSQLYFEDAITDQIQAIAPYRNRTTERIRNVQDGLFSRGGDQLLIPTTASEQGYSGIFNIGLELSNVSLS